MILKSLYKIIHLSYIFTRNNDVCTFNIGRNHYDIVIKNNNTLHIFQHFYSNKLNITWYFNEYFNEELEILMNWFKEKNFLFRLNKI